REIAASRRTAGPSNSNSTSQTAHCPKVLAAHFLRSHPPGYYRGGKARAVPVTRIAVVIENCSAESRRSRLPKTCWSQICDCRPAVVLRPRSIAGPDFLEKK